MQRNRTHARFQVPRTRWRAFAADSARYDPRVRSRLLRIAYAIVGLAILAYSAAVLAGVAEAQSPWATEDGQLPWESDEPGHGRRAWGRLQRNLVYGNKRGCVRGDGPH
jgi:hypothetical protein